MRQRIGASPASFNWGATAVAFRFDDISDDSLHLVAAILDTMRHYGVRATFALCYRHVKGLPESFNYTTSNFSGLGEIRNLVAAGHEGADHSPAHWFPPGQTAAKYQSCIDSSRTWFRTYLGVEPRLFIQPGGTQNGTPLFDEAFRAAVSNNYDYGMTWIQQEWPGNPKSDRLKMIYGTQHANSSRYWLPSWSFDLYDMAMAQKTFAEYLPVNGFFSVYMHLTNTTQVKQASMFMKFLDSLGVSMIPVSEMADLYVGSRWPNSGNLFSNTNLLCKIANLTLVGTSGSHWECPDGVRIMNTHSVTWDYLYPYATPCSDKGGAIKMSLSSEPHPHFPDNGAGMLFRVDGIEPGARYRVSVYIKNPNAGSFTEVPHIAVRQLKDCGYSPVVGTTHIDSLSLVRPDSTWHYWSHEITAQDSTDQIGLYVYAGTYGGYVIVACPSIEQVGPAGGAVIPTGGFLPLKGYLSADADTAYVQKVDGTYGKIPIQ
jgi:peptidoglycan/xylan/chitin deacetylase (PgdA/CDA1 family)